MIKWVGSIMTYVFLVIKIVVLKLSIVLEQKLKFYHVDSVSSDRCCSVRLAVHQFVQLGINAEVKMGS